MNVEVYNEIVGVINNHLPFDGRSCRKALQEKYPNVPEWALRGIMSLQIQRQMKCTLYRKMSKIDNLYSRYNASVNAGEKPGILLRMAKEQELCPSLLARGMLEKHYENKEVSRNYISSLMKDTNLIENHQLAYEVYLCIIHDEEYGPISNSFNHSIGIEYEMKLQKAVRDLGVPFHDENHLRTSGYDKTPDVKLEIPIAVNGFVVNWIESKASFGDEESHGAILKNQLLSYVNRFGTGMVIYWFGYVENIVQGCEKQILIKDHFPLEVTLMDPQRIDPSIDDEHDI